MYPKEHQRGDSSSLSTTSRIKWTYVAGWKVLWLNYSFLLVHFLAKQGNINLHIRILLLVNILFPGLPKIVISVITHLILLFSAWLSNEILKIAKKISSQCQLVKIIENIFIILCGYITIFASGQCWKFYDDCLMCVGHTGVIKKYVE